MLLAKNDVIPPREWMHDYTLKDNKGDTLKEYL